MLKPNRIAIGYVGLKFRLNGLKQDWQIQPSACAFFDRLEKGIMEK